MKLNTISFGEALHQAMSQAMKLDKNVLTYGLGVGKTSNIFGTTKDLIKKFGKNRVFDTPSAESALTAMAISTKSFTIKRVSVLAISFANGLHIL